MVFRPLAEFFGLPLQELSVVGLDARAPLFLRGGEAVSKTSDLVPEAVAMLPNPIEFTSERRESPFGGLQPPATARKLLLESLKPALPLVARLLVCSEVLALLGQPPDIVFGLPESTLGAETLGFGPLAGGVGLLDVPLEAAEAFGLDSGDMLLALLFTPLVQFGSQLLDL